MSEKKNLREVRQELGKQTKEKLKSKEETPRFIVETIGHVMAEANREGVSSSSSRPGGGAHVGCPNRIATSSLRGTVMENIATSGAGVSTKNTVVSRYELDFDSQRKVTPSPGREHVERVVEEYSCQVKDLQRRLSETTELHEKQKYHLRQSIFELQTKLQELQMERDALIDIRRKETQSQEEVKAQLQVTVHELETASCLQEEMLKESSNQSEQLRKVLQTQEDALREIRDVLVGYEESTGKRIYEHEPIAHLHIRSLGTVISKVLRELDTEVSYLKGRIFPVEEQLESLKNESQNKVQLLLQQHQDRIEQLVDEHKFEVAELTEKANNARCQAKSFQSQMAIIQDQARNQNSLYMRQLSELESTVSQLRSELRETKRISEDKVEELEKQLALSNSQLTEARTERDQFSQESGNLDDKIQMMLADLHKKDKELSLEKEQNKRLWDRDTGNSITIDHLRRELDDRNMEVQHLESLVKKMKNDSQDQMERQMATIQEKNANLEKVSCLATQLESTKEMLRKAVEELTAKKITLEASERTVADLTATLQEKERAVEGTNAEVVRLRSRVDVKLQELQHLKEEGEHLRNVQSDCEALRLQMAEKDKVVDILQQQIEKMSLLVGQHGRTAGAMKVEKSQLEKEVNDRKLELQELKVLKDKRDSRIRELEAQLSSLDLEKNQLVKSGTERLRALKELKLEREQLTMEVKASRNELARISEDYEVLKRNYRNKSEEMECTTQKLKMQLKSAQAELEQTRITLKSMEGADGQALKVAMGMQKQITAKRGQIDALESKIQFLEEAMENTSKEKDFLREEKMKLNLELNSIATEKNKMAGELEILKSQERRLKEKVANMENALDKASLQFAECQDIILRQEQESVRLKLQHTLDVRELQGPGYTSGSSTKQRLPRASSLPRPASSVLPTARSSLNYATTVASKSSVQRDDPTRDLKQLLQELRSVINEEPPVPLTKMDGADGGAAPGGSLRGTAADTSREPTADSSLRSDTYNRSPTTSYLGDLEEPAGNFSFSSTGSPSSLPAGPPFSSSPKSPRGPQPGECSPVHALLTSFPEDGAASSAASAAESRSARRSRSPDKAKSVSFSPYPPAVEPRSGAGQLSATLPASKPNLPAFQDGAPASPASPPTGATRQSCQKLHTRLEGLQCMVERLQLKNQAMSSMIKTQEKRIQKVKDQEKMLLK
ncbi:coiled-coil domain-containing protein 158 isoform X3 [Ornithorhynchus anatinus]|uniref:Coiled-coil domain containing 158 n=1 Tax=Ornithorhynchus anatinus TaxID=9258 RepID=A0A6I8NJN0_ORNAN|nr:coiled-coil domain-containing protein 158 isoform X3 [Ornithorhynchus anatinus]